MYTNKTKNWDLPQYQSTDTLNKNDLNTAFKNISDGAGVLSSEIGDLRINDARLEEIADGIQSQINYSNGVQQTHTSEIMYNKTAIGVLNQRMAKLQTDYLAHETKLDDVEETLGEQGEQISQLETDTATLTENFNSNVRVKIAELNKTLNPIVETCSRVGFVKFTLPSDVLKLSTFDDFTTDYYGKYVEVKYTGFLFRQGGGDNAVATINLHSSQNVQIATQYNVGVKIPGDVSSLYSADTGLIIGSIIEAPDYTLIKVIDAGTSPVISFEVPYHVAGSFEQGMPYRLEIGVSIIIYD